MTLSFARLDGSDKRSQHLLHENLPVLLTGLRRTSSFRASLSLRMLMKVLQVPSIGPFDEGDLADQLRFDPGAFFHFFCGQHLSPSRGSLLGQIGERAMRSSGFLQHWEDLLPNPRDPAGGVGPIFYIFSGISLQRFDGCHSKTFSDRRCLSTRMYIVDGSSNFGIRMKGLERICKPEYIALESFAITPPLAFMCR